MRRERPHPQDCTKVHIDDSVREDWGLRLSASAPVRVLGGKAEQETRGGTNRGGGNSQHRLVLSCLIPTRGMSKQERRSGAGGAEKGIQASQDRRAHLSLEPGRAVQCSPAGAQRGGGQNWRRGRKVRDTHTCGVNAPSHPGPRDCPSPPRVLPYSCLESCLRTPLREGAGEGRRTGAARIHNVVTRH